MIQFPSNSEKLRTSRRRLEKRGITFPLPGERVAIDTETFIGCDFGKEPGYSVQPGAQERFMNEEPRQYAIPATKTMEGITINHGRDTFKVQSEKLLVHDVAETVLRVVPDDDLCTKDPRRFETQDPNEYPREVPLTDSFYIEREVSGKFCRVAFTSADRARDLTDRATDIAKKHPDTDVRVMREGGKRAVLKFRYSSKAGKLVS